MKSRILFSMMCATVLSAGLSTPTSAAKKSDFSCRSYLAAMERAQDKKAVVPWQLRQIAGVMYGAFFAATRQSFTLDTGDDFERYAQAVRKECRSSPSADAREIAVRLAARLESSEKVVPSQDDPAWKQKAIDELEKESGIVEVLFPQGSEGSLWVSMRDDGSRRDGFAEFVCLKLHEAGLPKMHMVIVHIWDAAAMVRGEFTEIGKTECQFIE